MRSLASWTLGTIWSKFLIKWSPFPSDIEILGQFFSLNGLQFQGSVWMQNYFSCWTSWWKSMLRIIFKKNRPYSGGLSFISTVAKNIMVRTTDSWIHPHPAFDIDFGKNYPYGDRVAHKCNQCEYTSSSVGKDEFTHLDGHLRKNACLTSVFLWFCPSIWKYTVEKSQTNVTNMIMRPLRKW